MSVPMRRRVIPSRKMSKNKGTKKKTVINNIKPPSKRRMVVSGNSKYLMKRRLQAKLQAKEERRTKDIGNRYVLKKTVLNELRVERKLEKMEERKKKLEEMKKSKKISIAQQSYSGTIIYQGNQALHPYKWKPNDPENKPSHYHWESILPGTHVLDQKTRLTWIVEKNRTLVLAPCQTLKLDIELPDPLSSFNPGLCLNPLIPELSKIPIGTGFIFKNSPHLFLLGKSGLTSVEATLSKPKEVKHLSCYLKIPLDEPVYFRSLALIPKIGEPIAVLNKLNSYNLDEIERFVDDIKAKLLNLGHPYNQIKISDPRKTNDYLMLKMTELPDYLWGMVISSDSIPFNKYSGSGKFYLGYSTISKEPGLAYMCELEGAGLNQIEVYNLSIDDQVVDLNDEVIRLNKNCNVSKLFNIINLSLAEKGYEGYTMHLWWNDDDDGGTVLRFYLYGVIDEKLPKLTINLNNHLVFLDFHQI